MVQLSIANETKIHIGCLKKGVRNEATKGKNYFQNYSIISSY